MNLYGILRKSDNSRYFPESLCDFIFSLWFYFGSTNWELQPTSTTEKYKSWRKKSVIYTSNSRIIQRQTKNFLYPLLIYWNWLTTDIHFSRVRKQLKNEKSWISYLRTLRQTAVSFYIKQKSRSENCSFVLKVENGSPNWIRTSDLPVNSRLLYRWAIGE